MPNTYTQIHLQLVFAVKYRVALIQNDWREELHQYMAGIIQNQNHKLMIVNGVTDHVHMLIGYRPHQSLSDLIQDIKGSSSRWINEKGFIKSKFLWQEGYGAFSYSHSHLQNVINYIKKQEEHHRKITLMDEYRSFLKAFEIEYDEKYILKDPE